MSSKKNKRFLVTYADHEVSRASAVKLLGVSQARMKEGVSFMSGNRAALADKVLHFDNLAVSVLAADIGRCKAPCNSERNLGSRRRCADAGI